MVPNKSGKESEKVGIGRTWVAQRKKAIDRRSSSFEHAAIATDLDGDGKDELYVASDKHKEVRRYTWSGSRLVPETIYSRDASGGGVFTWNIMPVPIALVP